MSALFLALFTMRLKIAKALTSILYVLRPFELVPINEVPEANQSSYFSNNTGFSSIVGFEPTPRRQGDMRCVHLALLISEGQHGVDYLCLSVHKGFPLSTLYLSILINKPWEVLDNNMACTTQVHLKVLLSFSRQFHPCRSVRPARDLTWVCTTVLRLSLWKGQILVASVSPLFPPMFLPTASHNSQLTQLLKSSILPSLTRPLATFESDYPQKNPGIDVDLSTYGNWAQDSAFSAVVTTPRSSTQINRISPQLHRGWMITNQCKNVRPLM